MIRYLSKLLYILSGQKRSIIILLMLSVLTAFFESLGVGLIGPFLKVASEPTSLHNNTVFNWIYGQLNLNSNKQFILILGLITFVVFLIKSIVFLSTNKYLFKFIYNHKKELTCRLFSSYLNAPYSFHLMENTASSIDNITLETTILAQDCLLPFLSATVNAIIISFLILLLANINSTLLLLIMGVILFIFTIFTQYGKSLKQWGKIRTQTNQDIVFTINQGLGGFKETRIIGCESYFEKKMIHYVNKWKIAVTQCQMSHISLNVIIQTSLIAVVIFYVCIANFLAGENVQDVTIVIGAFAAASLRLIPSLNQFMMSLGKLKNSSYVLDSIYRELKKLNKLNREILSINSTNYSYSNKSVSSGFRDLDRNRIPAQ